MIPAYNEQDNIVSAVEDLKENAPFVDYIVVDDGSTDATAAICARQGYRHLTLPINLGLAAAFQTGMKYALREGYEYALQFDADGQHSAAYIKDLITTAERLDADIVIGSRFSDRKRPFSARMAGSLLITFMIKVTTGSRVADPTSGMRLFRGSMVRLFAQEFDYGPEPDTLALVLRNGAKVGETQVEMRERIAGESYLNFTKSVSYMLRMSVSILFAQWFRRKR